MVDADHVTFLLCSERSGSNFTAAIIGAHDEVCSPSPTHLFRVILENVNRYGRLQREPQRHRFIDDVLGVFAAKTGVWLTDVTRADVEAAIARGGPPAVVLLRLYEREMRAAGASRLFIKENGVAAFAFSLALDLPSVRFLHVVRDPRDMALSWKRAVALRGGVLRASRRWRDDQEGFMRLTGGLADTGRVATTTYEDLTSDPRGVLDACLAPWGLGWQPRMEEFHQEGLAKANAASAIEWRNIARPTMQGNYGKWRDGLQEGEIAWVEATCVRQMQALGYELSSNPDEADLTALEAVLSAIEPMEKPAYAQLDAAERARRDQWHRVVTSIRDQPVAPEIVRAKG